MKETKGQKVAWILSAMLFVVLPMSVITILAVDNQAILFIGTVVLTIAIILIGLFGKQSPYADEVFCTTCKKITKQRVVVPALRFMPKFECEVCSNLNEPGAKQEQPRVPKSDYLHPRYELIEGGKK
jgi:hypothetical protein